jgi:hypothetical protein
VKIESEEKCHQSILELAPVSLRFHPRIRTLHFSDVTTCDEATDCGSGHSWLLSEIAQISTSPLPFPARNSDRPVGEKETQHRLAVRAELLKRSWTPCLKSARTICVRSQARLSPGINGDGTEQRGS